MFQGYQGNLVHNVIFSVCENRLLVKQIGEEGSEETFWSYEIIENLFLWSNQGTWKLVIKKDFAISCVYLNLLKLLRVLPLYRSWKTCETSKVTLQQGNCTGF